MSKEERNKHIEIFPHWLELYFSKTHITPQGIFCKEDKNYHLDFEGSFLETPYSACVNKFALTKDEIELNRDSAMTRCLVRMNNIQISYLKKDVLIFDNYFSGKFCHVKFHP